MVTCLGKSAHAPNNFSTAYLLSHTTTMLRSPLWLDCDVDGEQQAAQARALRHALKDGAVVAMAPLMLGVAQRC